MKKDSKVKKEKEIYDSFVAPRARVEPQQQTFNFKHKKENYPSNKIFYIRSKKKASCSSVVILLLLLLLPPKQMKLFLQFKSSKMRLLPSLLKEHFLFISF